MFSVALLNVAIHFSFKIIYISNLRLKMIYLCWFHNSAIAYFAQRIDRYFGQKKGRKLQIYLRNLRGRSEDRNKKSLLQQVQLFRAAAVSEHHWT